jgi:predicted DsbA family dithiol-disulfide isomerase
MARALLIIARTLSPEDNRRVTFPPEAAPMPDPFPDRLTIDIVSDVVCPWCYIGKRRLEAALAELAVRQPAVHPFVSWHPFQLNPDLPREGIDRRAYVEDKFGGPERAHEVYARIRGIGAEVGIAFAFEAIRRQPNTRDAHRLISWAQAQGDADALVERLFRAYFIEGRYVGDREVLAALAGEAGLPADAARTYLATDQGDDAIVAMDRRVRELGVGGVPFFIFDGRIAVSGAQEPQTLLDAIAEARESLPETAPI